MPRKNPPSRPLRRTPVRGAVVLITGGASGIGRLMGLEAARRGAGAVVVWDLDAPGARRVVEEVRRLGGRGRAWGVDVTSSEAVDAAAAQVLAAYGRVDILINSAGVVTGKRFADLTEADVQRTFDVNVFALYRTARAFLPGMRARNRGCVATIASAAGLVGVSRQSDYSASKFAAIGFMESLRSELRHEGSAVRTLIVAPYYIDTGMFDGVRTRVPALLPILRPQWAAERVLDSLERGDQRRVLPRFANAVLLLKGLPVPVLDRVADMFGIASTMDHFTGRTAR